MTDSPYAGEFSRMLMDLGYEESASRLKQFGRSDEIPFLDISKALLADGYETCARVVDFWGEK
ncbi:hypothetical protein [Gluconobacter kondonii]|uniref:hypothetical protein n=1 Tax=Gluconobacter kondonii TaxID=941463 RepID=UPI001B8CF5C4|nr:hypothetical protein [Gluconobacter kondonii]MBS1084550.1 hypothetical protein [Gluconobacter kondonii]